ncbi:cupin domain-containing protein [Mucilaginibacter hurinus]|uniref:Cupin domain-containing protein n=1 Tax=Mucilaginibacter hurinus TaxID=2201324 RepID=A0A367GK26_9SPHI|nr:cupin domain-containing protein [Mucilaginibacter hurinus]RCH53827.1 cupin domain-containing protein [Mucilaginibacter hurinus]
MAYKGKILNNPVTGQSIKFLQTNSDTCGQLLEIETTYSASSTEPPAHVHPYQDEYFTVLDGELRVKLGGELIALRAGDALYIPANQPHAMWNDSAEKTVVNWQVRPAMTTEYLFETTWGLAADGKVNKRGMPNLLQAAITVNKYSDVFRFVKPPFRVQKFCFYLLTPVAYLFGYRATYKKYIIR